MNLLVEFVGDIVDCKNIMKILKLKIGVRIFIIFLKEYNYGIYKDEKNKKIK